MKILISSTLFYSYKVSGAEVSVQFLAEGLAGICFNANVACVVTQGLKRLSEL